MVTSQNTLNARAAMSNFIRETMDTLQATVRTIFADKDVISRTRLLIQLVTHSPGIRANFRKVLLTAIHDTEHCIPISANSAAALPKHSTWTEMTIIQLMLPTMGRTRSSKDEDAEVTIRFNLNILEKDNTFKMIVRDTTTTDLTDVAIGAIVTIATRVPDPVFHNGMVDLDYTYVIDEVRTRQLINETYELFQKI